MNVGRLQGDERRLARARAYALLGLLYREGPVPYLIEELSELPVLADALPEPFDSDAALAEHHELFSLQVFPYGGAFLEKDGRAGGPSAQPAREAAAFLTLQGALEGETEDYLPRELEMLSGLSEGEAMGVAGARDQAGLLLTRHLLWWLPPFAVAVIRQGRPFWTLVTELTVEVVVDHLRGLGVAAPSEASPLPPEPAPDPWEGPRGLQEAATFLTSPARSGLQLSLGSLRRMARRLSLPSGFGRRERVLENLLESAVEYDAGPEFLEALLVETDAARQGYMELARGAPELETVTGAWIDRLGGTDGMLRALAGALAGKEET